MNDGETNWDSQQSREEERSFEDSLAALEGAVHELEDGQLGLSEALARYEESVKHLRRCYQLLDAAEQRIELLTGVADDGTALSEPFVEMGEPDARSVGKRKNRRARANGEAGGDMDASAAGT